MSLLLLSEAITKDFAHRYAKSWTSDLKALASSAIRLIGGSERDAHLAIRFIFDGDEDFIDHGFNVEDRRFLFCALNSITD